MNRGGRPLHKYWEEENHEKRYEGKKLFAYCMICKKTIRHTAETRLRDHRRSCQEPLIDDEEFEEVIININRDESDTNTTIHSDLDSIMLNVTNEENLENTDASATSSSNAIQIQLPKRSVLRPIDNNGQNKKALSNKKRKQIDEFIDKISCAEKAAIDNSLITFLCGCNIPFDILNSTHFKKFVKLLRPAYEHPSKSTVNTLLNSVYDQLTTDSSTYEQSEGILMISSSMLSQGVDSKHIVGIVHTKSRGNLFLKIWSIPINANNVTEIVDDAVQISKEKYKVDIYAVIADDDLCRKHPSLANFAKKLTQIPALVAQVKFQTICCDNISPDNNKKIIELYYRLKLQDENITDKY
ncbi:uncharacterized protein LOC112453438 [Temnothorax curvispinosus]|uniref:Uncharacterized protein LOC112453438 n=1 Tax=Temnothorax curvispinosus TaxID=300111 RepID=A0A6J1PKX4_9HYME|nr:uncharacterized protein LOC112453438 [Temnothorax curvispinosus]